MEKPSHAKLTNEAKLKSNSVIKHFHNMLNHYDEMRTETCGTITKEQFINEYFRLIEEFEDLVKNGTNTERAKFILLSQIKKNIEDAINGEHRERDVTSPEQKDIN